MATYLSTFFFSVLNPLTGLRVRDAVRQVTRGPTVGD